MRRLLNYLSACYVVYYGAVATTPNGLKYTNGCVFVEKQDDILSRYDPEQLSPPFVDCGNLGLASIDYTIFNDTIRSLGLSGNQLTTFNASNIVRFSNLHFLDLGRNKIATVTAVNVSHSLGNIYFGSNLLRKIPSVLFKSFKQLSSLNLFNNKITVIKENDFVGAASLTSLTLTRNPIKQLSELAFGNINHLLTLDLADCGLIAVPSFIQNMKGMFLLNLGHNNITSVASNAFVNNSGLRMLSLASNKIDTIHPNAFDGAVKLTVIVLSDNKITTIPEGIFNNMADENSGMFIEMYENPIRCDCKLQWLSQWLDNLEVREEIELTCAQPARNRGKHFHSITTSDLTCKPDDKDWNEDTCTTEPTPSPTDDSDESTLCPTNCECYHKNGTKYQSVDIPGSQSKKRRWWDDKAYPFVDCMDAGLTEFPQNIRRDVVNLRLLGNKIESLSIKWLKPFTELVYLNIEGCGLKNIIPDQQTVLPNLARVEIQNNKLQTLTKAHLSSFPKIHLLSINDNKLQNIPIDLFDSTQNLRVLSIGPNPIKVFNPRCMDGLDLTSLSLPNMSLTAIPTLSFPNLLYLDLNDNAFTAIPNNSFSGIPRVVRMMLAHNQIEKVEVNAFKGCTRLNQIDLVENKIGILYPGVFDDLNRDRLSIQLYRNRMVCDCKMKWFKEWLLQLDEDDPQTDVRFSCFKPWRVHAKTSDTMQPDDFICKTEDSQPHSSDDDDACYTGGQIALAVILTMLFTILAGFLIRLLCRIRDRNIRYQRTAEDTARLDLDM